MKKILIIAILILLVSIYGYSRTILQNKNDAMARAYKACTEKKIDIAKDWFRKAGSFAQNANDWQGLLDAGYGLSTLGRPEEAEKYFSKTEKIVIQKEDWHGAVALGYAYASLPKSLNLLNKAVELWQKAGKWARDKNDMYGIIETGRGFMSIGMSIEAEKYFDIAKKLLKKIPDSNAARILAQAYKKMGGNKAIKYNQPKPEAGKTIRKPKNMPIELQKAQRASIDKDIETQAEWRKEQMRLENQKEIAQEQKFYQYYRNYMYYYSYPYYGIYTSIITDNISYYNFAWSPMPVWSIRTYPEIYNWAQWNLNRYTYRDGVYIAIDTGLTE